MLSNKLINKLVISLCSAAAVVLLTVFGALYSMDNWAKDILYQHEYRTNLPVYVIGIDEATVNELGQYSDWDRSVYAKLVENLCADEVKPKVIVFDVLFTGYKSEEGDNRFVESVKKHGNVIAGTWLNFDEKYSESNHQINKELYIDSVSLPFKELDDVTYNAFVNTSTDSDGVIRTMLTSLTDNEGNPVDSLALAAYERYMGLEIGTKKYERSSYNFSYSTTPSTVKEVSFADVYNGRRDAREFADSIVFVGAYAEGFFDAFPVPIDRSSKMYGVAIHENIVQAIYSDKLQVPISDGLVACIYGLLIFALTFLLLSLPLSYGGIATAALVILQGVLCILLNKAGYCAAYIYFPLTSVILYVSVVIYQYISIRIEKAKINNAFKMYVAPQIVDEVARSGNYELKLGGQTKDIAVLFIDIRGFTTMSEGLEPETVVEILNEYFAVITDAVFANGGTLDKFIGDAAMAVFNSPFDLDDYELRAVKSALDIAAKSEELKQKLLARFGKTVNYGIGINAGPATIGNIGCEFRMDYTAIGDTVNTSSRLEANAKAGQILISEEVYKRIGDKLVAEDIGELKLKGKSIGIHTYNVLSLK